MRTPDVVLIAWLVAACAPAAYRAPATEPRPAPGRARPGDAPGAAALTPAPAGFGSAGRAAGPAPRVDAPAPPPASPFWQSLGDPVLDRLLTEALTGNLDVQAADARIRAARADRRGAELERIPSLTAGAGYTRQRLASVVFPGSGGGLPHQSVWDVGFDASWELDLFGRLRHTVQARSALLDAAGHDLRDVQVALLGEVARTYFELRGAEEQIDVARRNAENQQRTLALVRDRLATGIGSAFDTERAEAQLAFTLAAVPALEAEASAARFRLGVLLGRSPAAMAAELAEPARLPELPGEVMVAPSDTLVRRRPDVAAAERRVAWASSIVASRKAAYLPRLDLGATAGFAAGGVDALGRSGTFRYAAGPAISWPALNLGRVRAAVDASRAVELEAQAQYRHTALRALEEVEASLVRYHRAGEQASRLRDAADASARAAELARVRFTEGLVDFLQVLDAERTQLEAESRLAAARAAAATSYAVLYKALGGDLPLR